MKYYIWRQCGRKKRYKNEHDANYFRKLFEKEREKKLDYYWCEFCNGYHLTSRESYSYYPVSVVV